MPPSSSFPSHDGHYQYSAAMSFMEHPAREWQVVANPVIAKGVWSEEEHNKFLEAFKLFPHGPWKAITSHIGTRSIRQVQTHAQKYQEKVQRRARGLKTAHPRLVRTDHRIDDEIEPWWSRASGMLAGSPTRTGKPRRRQRQKHRRGSDDVSMTSDHSSSRKLSSDDDCDEEGGAEDEYEGKMDDEYEPLPLRTGPHSSHASDLPSLEECLAVVNECLMEEALFESADRRAFV